MPILERAGPRVIQAYREMRNRISRGDFEFGDALPSQRVLSQELGVSLVTLNRAVALLVNDGLVESRVGSGVYVSRPAESLSASGIISYMYLADGESLTHVQQGALARGYLLSVFSQCQNNWNPNAERHFLRKVKEQRHHGLLAFCSPTAPRNDDLLRELVVAGVRVLHIEHYCVDLPEQPYLLPDFERAGHAAVINLLLAGYRRIRFLSQEPPSTREVPFMRLLAKGMQRALADHGAESTSIDENWLPFPSHVDHEERLAASLAAVEPDTGIVAYSDNAASEVVEHLRRRGRSVPDTIGVIGIDVAGSANVKDVDIMSFDREALLDRAIAMMTAPDWREPRELAPAKWIKQGTVR